MLDWCIYKINEVAQDLREPQDGADLEHQARKLDEVAQELHKIRGGGITTLEDYPKPGPSTEVHGGGTGDE